MELKELRMERFKKLLPEIASIKSLGYEDGMDLWEVYNGSEALIGYAFDIVVPDFVSDLIDMDEMDKYQVRGIVDSGDHKILKIDIALHPEGPEEPWTMEISEPEFTNQFIGLTLEEIDLSPDGKIDSITDATLSSTWITNAIRDKVDAIIQRVS